MTKNENGTINVRLEAQITKWLEIQSFSIKAVFVLEHIEEVLVL